MALSPKIFLKKLKPGLQIAKVSSEKNGVIVLHCCPRGLAVGLSLGQSLAWSLCLGLGFVFFLVTFTFFLVLQKAWSMALAPSIGQPSAWASLWKARKVFYNWKHVASLLKQTQNHTFHMCYIYERHHVNVNINVLHALSIFYCLGNPNSSLGPLNTWLFAWPRLVDFLHSSFDEDITEILLRRTLPPSEASTDPLET